MQTKIERLLCESLYAIQELSEEVKMFNNWEHAPYQQLVLRIKEILYQNKEK